MHDHDRKRTCRLTRTETDGFFFRSVTFVNRKMPSVALSLQTDCTQRHTSIDRSVKDERQMNQPTDAHAGPTDPRRQDTPAAKTNEQTEPARRPCV